MADVLFGEAVVSAHSLTVRGSLGSRRVRVTVVAVSGLVGVEQIWSDGARPGVRVQQIRTSIVILSSSRALSGVAKRSGGARGRKDGCTNTLSLAPAPA
jgi:hypothetical protein